MNAGNDSYGGFAGGGGAGARVLYFVASGISGHTGTYTVSSTGGAGGSYSGTTPGATGPSTTFAWKRWYYRHRWGRRGWCRAY